MKLLRLLPLAALAIAATSFSAEIGPGSLAPKLEVKTWYKGTPVKEFAPDKIYVVEFWATWCGPCIQSIPHVTKLAKENKDVTFIGVSIWEDDNGTNIQKFVADMGDKMDYNVGYSGNKEGMATSWMEPAAQNGIPAAFIIKDGRIAWIGHPMSMDKPLAETKAGTFDTAAFKASFDKQAEKTRIQMKANAAISAAIKMFDEGKRAEAHTALQKAIGDYPSMKASAEATLFKWLAVEDLAAWEKQAVAISESKDSGKINQLCSFALSQAAGKTPNLDLARKAIGIALKGTEGNDFYTQYYAANVYDRTGDFKLGLDAINKAIDLFPTSQFKGDPGFKSALEKLKSSIQAKMNG